MTEINSNSKTELFSQFSKHFQEKIVQALVIDQQWATQMVEVLNPQYFEFQHLKLFSSKYVDHYNKYKDFPSLELMIDILKMEFKNSTDNVLKDFTIDFIKRMKSNPDMGDIGLVKEKSLEFCKRMALKKALLECTDLVNTNKYESIVEVLKKSINLGTNTSPGMDLLEDVALRYTENSRKTIPTGIPELDHKEVLNGGLARGEIGVVVAPTGVGKTHLLIQFGAEALKRGHNVLHYTFELSEVSTGNRYDANLCDIPILDCFERQEEIKEFYRADRDLGKLKIKYFPTSTITVLQLYTHMEKLQTQGFKPDILIIDYASIMRSSEKNDLLRLEIKRVFEELRGMAGELNIPIWTASQSNREALNSDIVEMQNTAESFSSIHVVDVMLGYTRDKKSSVGKLNIAKNRAGKDGVVFTTLMDTSRSKLRVLSDQDVEASSPTTTKDNVQNYMRKAYNKIVDPTVGMNVEKIKKN